MEKNVVIQAEHISKEYRLGEINHGTLYRDLQSWYAKLRGRPDPNRKFSDSGDGNQSARIEGEFFRALDDVSFSIEQGDITGIIGKNGAGKSTLLKILSRITAPSRGKIGLKGRVASLLEVGTGFHPELTGRENVYLNGAILGMRRHEVRAKFEQIVEFAEIGDFIDTPVKRYSSGMYVRLAFAVAAHLEPEILVVDEVLAVGDGNFQKKCLGRMQEVGEEGRTVLFVSHNLSAVKRLCSKGIVMNAGRTIYHGEVEEALDVYQNISRGSEAVSVYKRKPSASLETSPAFFNLIHLKDADDQIKGTFGIGEPIVVHLEYQLNRPMKGLGIYLIVVDHAADTNLILSCDVETNHDLLADRAQGKYIATTTIPAHFLNTGQYRLRARMTTGSSHYDIVDDVFFDVFDEAGHMQILGIDRKNSTLFYPLNWKTEFSDPKG